MMLNKRYSCFIILVVISACSSGENQQLSDNKQIVIDQQALKKNEAENIYLFKQSLKSNETSSIPYVLNMPVYQLEKKLKPIHAPFEKVLNHFESMGFLDKFTHENYKKTYETRVYQDTNSSILLKSNEYQGIVNINYTNPNLKSILYIYIRLTYGGSFTKYGGMDKDLFLPTTFINFITKIGEKESEQFYNNLLNEHINNIENKKCEFSDYSVTTRKNIEDYWFEINTDMQGKGTVLYMYKTNAVPKIGYPVKKYGYC